MFQDYFGVQVLLFLIHSQARVRAGIRAKFPSTRSNFDVGIS